MVSQRDSAYLEWRFGDSLLGQKLVVKESQGGKAIGSVVMKLEELPVVVRDASAES